MTDNDSCTVFTDVPAFIPTLLWHVALFLRRWGRGLHRVYSDQLPQAYLKRLSTKQPIFDTVMKFLLLLWQLLLSLTLLDSKNCTLTGSTVCGFIYIDSNCDQFWESNQKLQACYQFNLYTILTWSQALSTCQAQGGNLLSITSLDEHRYIRGRNLVENTYSDQNSFLLQTVHLT